MSAIFGVVNLKENKVDNSVHKYVKESYNKYLIDKFQYLYEENLFMSCALQYLTKESLTENLPYKKKHIIITTDAILDNREELIKELSIDTSYSDSQIILKAYEKWGDEVSEHIIGDFAIGIWDKEQETLLLIRDHTGKQALYYYFEEETVIFSTTIKPIISWMKNNNKAIALNKEWIKNFNEATGMINEKELGETHISKIHILPPSTKIIFTKNSKKEENYWNPLENKSIKFKTEEEYNKRFLEVFEEAVKCRLRTIGDVGIQISGGLDSTSVAMLALKELKKQKKTLNGYNFTHYDGFKPNLPKYLISNESEYIDEITKISENFNIEYISCEENNSVKSAKDLVEVLEMPYRIVENLYWGVDIMKKGKNKGCKVMLTGQYGNCTISLGDFPILYKSFLLEGKIKTFLKELNEYCKKYNAPKRGVLKYILKDFNKDSSFKEIKKSIVSKKNLSHLGVIENKISLYTGVINRDPTRDKRVIELCLSYPSNQFIKNGQDRFLVRRAMKGILPEKIRTNYKIKGRQSADWIERIFLWDEFEQEVDQMVCNIRNEEYINKLIIIENMNKYKKAKECFLNGEDYAKEMDGKEFKKIIVSLIFNYYLNSF